MSPDLTQLQVSRYGCPLCGAPAVSLAAKKKHMRSYHPKTKKVK